MDRRDDIIAALKKRVAEQEEQIKSQALIIASLKQSAEEGDAIARLTAAEYAAAGDGDAIARLTAAENAAADAAATAGSDDEGRSNPTPTVQIPDAAEQVQKQAKAKAQADAQAQAKAAEDAFRRNLVLEYRSDSPMARHALADFASSMSVLRQYLGELVETAQAQADGGWAFTAATERFAMAVTQKPTPSTPRSFGRQDQRDNASSSSSADNSGSPRGAHHMNRGLYHKRSELRECIRQCYAGVSEAGAIDSTLRSGAEMLLQMSAAFEILMLSIESAVLRPLRDVLRAETGQMAGVERSVAALARSQREYEHALGEYSLRASSSIIIGGGGSCGGGGGTSSGGGSSDSSNGGHLHLSGGALSGVGGGSGSYGSSGVGGGTSGGSGGSSGSGDGASIASLLHVAQVARRMYELNRFDCTRQLNRAAAEQKLAVAGALNSALYAHLACFHGCHELMRASEPGFNRQQKALQAGKAALARDEAVWGRARRRLEARIDDAAGRERLDVLGYGLQRGVFADEGAGGAGSEAGGGEESSGGWEASMARAQVLASAARRRDGGSGSRRQHQRCPRMNGYLLMRVARSKEGGGGGHGHGSSTGGGGIGMGLGMGMGIGSNGGSGSGGGGGLRAEFRAAVGGAVSSGSGGSGSDSSSSFGGSSSSNSSSSFGGGSGNGTGHSSNSNGGGTSSVDEAAAVAATFETAHSCGGGWRRLWFELQGGKLLYYPHGVLRQRRRLSFMRSRSRSSLDGDNSASDSPPRTPQKQDVQAVQTTAAAVVDKGGGEEEGEEEEPIAPGAVELCDVLLLTVREASSSSGQSSFVTGKGSSSSSGGGSTSAGIGGGPRMHGGGSSGVDVFQQQHLQQKALIEQHMRKQKDQHEQQSSRKNRLLSLFTSTSSSNSSPFRAHNSSHHHIPPHLAHTGPSSKGLLGDSDADRDRDVDCQQASVFSVNGGGGGDDISNSNPHVSLEFECVLADGKILRMVAATTREQQAWIATLRSATEYALNHQKVEVLRRGGKVGHDSVFGSDLYIPGLGGAGGVGGGSRVTVGAGEVVGPQGKGEGVGEEAYVEARKVVLKLMADNDRAGASEDAGASFEGGCCDCGTVPAEWAVINRGAFLCIDCAGIHRSMGVHISKVRSVALDSWTPPLAALFSALAPNTATVNGIFEHTMGGGWTRLRGRGGDADSSKTGTASGSGGAQGGEGSNAVSRQEREAFIRAKYEARAFVQNVRAAAAEAAQAAQAAMPPPAAAVAVVAGASAATAAAAAAMAGEATATEIAAPPVNMFCVEADMLQAAARGDAKRILWCLAQGADVDYTRTEDANKLTALRLAAQAGHSACVELLRQNGAAL